MRVWSSIEEIPSDLGRTVAVIGNFDGVHRGHRTVIQRARAIAAESGLDTVVAVTFDPHPMAVLRPDHAPVALATTAERLDLLHQAGVDDALVLRFDRDIAAWTPREFIDRVLVDGLHAGAVVVGANFRFGAKAAGDVSLLREVGETEGFQVVGVDLDGGPQVWSSTYIRTCIAAGDVEGAAQALGRLYCVRGVVEMGDQRGRELGYPTANVPVSGVAIPEDGVYAGWMTILDQRHPEAGSPLPAAISVGTNPTFPGERHRRVEAYVLDRTDLDLYDLEVEVAFVAHIRGMKTFQDIDELIATMGADVEQTRSLLTPS